MQFRPDCRTPNPQIPTLFLCSVPPYYCPRTGIFRVCFRTPPRSQPAWPSGPRPPTGPRGGFGWHPERRGGEDRGGGGRGRDGAGWRPERRRGGDLAKEGVVNLAIRGTVPRGGPRPAWQRRGGGREEAGGGADSPCFRRWGLPSGAVIAPRTIPSSAAYNILPLPPLPRQNNAMPPSTACKPPPAVSPPAAGSPRAG